MEYPVRLHPDDIEALADAIARRLKPAPRPYAPGGYIPPYTPYPWIPKTTPFGPVWITNDAGEDNA